MDTLDDEELSFSPDPLRDDGGWKEEVEYWNNVQSAVDLDTARREAEGLSSRASTAASNRSMDSSSTVNPYKSLSDEEIEEANYGPQRPTISSNATITQAPIDQPESRESLSPSPGNQLEIEPLELGEDEDRAFNGPEEPGGRVIAGSYGPGEGRRENSEDGFPINTAIASS